MRLLQMLGRQPPPVVLAAALATVAALGLADYLLPGRAALLFAVVPLLAAAYSAGRGPALATAGAAAAAWVINSFLEPHAAAVLACWDASLGAAFFVMAGLGAAALGEALRLTRESA